MHEAVGAADSIGAGAAFYPGLAEMIAAPGFSFDIVCTSPDGTEKWRETCHNLVTTEGKNNIIDNQFKGSAYTATWYLGLKGAGSAAAGDTLASHAGWSEVTPYAGNRPAITFGTTSAGSNTATAVAITINATATVAGAFIGSVNTGTSGKLYSAADFAASRGVASGDTITITPTVSVS